jgi:hypothetical protein
MRREDGRARARVLVAVLVTAAGVSVAIDWPPLGPVAMPTTHHMPTRCSTPRNLDEAHQVLAQFLAPELVRELRVGSGSVGTTDAVGRELRNIWGLWNGSPLRTYLVSLGLRHPDEMSELIFVTFGRYLRTQPLRVEEEVKRLRAGASRPTPQCPPCIRGGVCATESVVDGLFGPGRGFLVTDCCCGFRPQILEGVVKTLANGEAVVYPSMASFVYDASCRNVFGIGS